MLGSAYDVNTATESVNKGNPNVKYESGLPTVLLVEDTEDNRQMMRHLLQMSGFYVVEATNGKEAVQLAREIDPEIILMDLSLPIIDGLAATREIRSDPDFSNVPIVAVSAHDTADFHNDALNAGCDAYVTKPINYSELEELVNRLLQDKRRPLPGRSA